MNITCFCFHVGAPQIVKPLPENLDAIEFEKAKISCTVTDSSGAKPTRINFVRTSTFGDKEVIYHQDNGRIQYHNKTEGKIHCNSNNNLMLLNTVL